MRALPPATALALLLASGTAVAFPIEVTVETHGLQVQAEHSRAGNGTVMNLINHEPRAVRCEVHFRNGPERRRRRVTIDAAAQRTVTFMPQRAVARLRVNVECRPAHPDDEAEVDPDIEQLIEEQ